MKTNTFSQLPFVVASHLLEP